MTTANALIARERLAYFAEMLLATGWKREGGGWLPPQQYREALEMTTGKGALGLRNAVQAQVMFDEITVSNDEERRSDA